MSLYPVPGTEHPEKRSFKTKQSKTTGCLRVARREHWYLASRAAKASGLGCAILVAFGADRMAILTFARY